MGNVMAMPLDTCSWPPDAAVEVQQWVLDSVPQLRQLRGSLFIALTGEPMPPGGELDEVPEKIAVVATELATNALRHGRPPTQVTLSRTERTFVLDVADDDPTALPQLAGPRPPGAGGLGLHIVGEFASDLGWYADHGTKHVWAEFSIPTKGAAHYNRPRR
jgi:serine/threonine-protein kinase RsbW